MQTKTILCVIYIFTISVTLLMQACSGKQADARLLAKVDSLRRVDAARMAAAAKGENEQQYTLEDSSGLFLRSLPLRFSERWIEMLPDFVEVSASDLDAPYLEGYFRTLRAVALPSKNPYKVVLVAGDDSLSRRFLYVETISSKTGRMVDWMQVYRMVKGKQGETEGIKTTEFSITSRHEIFLEHYFSSGDTINHRFLDAQLFVIADDGHFLEQPIEM